MTGNRSIFRFLMTLVFAALIASPQPMVASELSDNAGSEGSTEVTSTPSDDNTGDNPGDPGGDDTTGGDGTTEGQAPEGEGTEVEGTEGEGTEGEGTEGEGTEGEGTEGEGAEGEGTEGEGAEGEGTEAQGPEKTNTDDDAKSIAPASTGGDFSILQVPPDMTPEQEREWFCDFSNQEIGDVAAWWAFYEVAPDCIDFLVVVNNEECSLTVTMSSWVYSSVSGNPITWNDSFAWYETDSAGVVLRPEGGGPPLNWQSASAVDPTGKTLVATFPEDHNGGTAHILVNFGSPENQISVGLSESDLAHWRTTSAGVLYNVNTDCEDPEPVNYCHYPGSHIGGVYNWLDNATREGNETDCIDVGEPVQACGSLDIPFESRITGFNSEYTLYWAVGSEIPGDDSLWNTTWPIEFDEDEFGGSVDVIVFVGGPEDDYYHFADIDPYPYPYPNTPQGGHDARSLGGGVEYTVLTDCEDPIPVNFCDYSQHTGAGDVYSWLAGAPEGSETDCIDVGTPVQVCGSLDIPFESRITGFQSEYTLYWAVGTEIPDDDSQWNTTWPIEFDEDENGGSVDVIVFIGGPEDDYYHFADEDPYPYPYPNQDRGDIPARSLGGGVQYTVLTDCDLEPAVLELPTVTLSVCDDAYQATPIVVIAPENSDSVTYSNVTAVSGPAGLTFTITATVNHGFTFEGITPPEGWTVVDNGLATYSVTLALADCEVPLKVATPELPTLVAAMCDDDNEPVLPTLTVPETEGITYGEVTVGPANSVLLSLTATANEGYTFAGATLPEGWTLVSSSEAVYQIVAEEADCPTPEPTETPTPDPTETPKPEDPKEKAPEVTELPTTGTGSNPAPMIGLAATAAAAIAGAGLFFTNRKR